MNHDPVKNKRTFVIKPKSIKYKDKHVSASFLQNENSPFDDHFDLVREREFLGELAFRDELELAHPAYLQWLECKKHEMLLKEYIMSGKVAGKGPRYKDIKNIDLTKFDILPDEAALFSRMSKLKNETVDTMQLHTVHAFRLWKGALRADGSNNKFAGMLTAISNTRRLVMISTDCNNPYADMSLIDIENRVVKLKNHFKQRSDNCRALIEKQKEMGLSLSVMVAREPLEIELSFDTPYGHLFTQILGQFDYCARMMVTLKNKALIGAQASRDEISKDASRIRSLIEFTHDSFSNIMPIKTFSRNLLMSKMTEDMAELLTNIAENYGQIPEDVLLKLKHPEYVAVHSRYNENDTNSILAVANRFGLIKKAGE